MSTVASDTMLLNTDLRENMDSFSLIISGSKVLENTLKVLNSSDGGFLIYKGPRPPTSLEIIFRQNIKNETYFFCKTVSTDLYKNTKYEAMSTNPGLPQSISS